jgi:hypothetical protein
LSPQEWVYSLKTAFTSTLCTRSFHQSGTRFSIWQNVYQCIWIV